MKNENVGKSSDLLPYCHNSNSLFDMGDPIEELLSWRLADKRHDTELWEFEYSISRYLLNLPIAELDQRYRSICKNISLLISSSRDAVPVQVHFHSTWWWLRKRAQLLAEYALRGVQPKQFNVEPITPASSPAPFHQPRPHDYKTLIRYGEARWLVPLAERGQIRFTPASSYKNEELGPARHDDELNQSTFTRGDRIAITTMDGKRISMIGDLKTTVNTSTDMYVYCVGNEYDARLFAEFPNRNGQPADAYCVIWDSQEFQSRMFTESNKYFSGWSFHHLPISYFDPYENGKNYISPGVCKKFDYAYQREYRFIWLPPGRAPLFGPVDLSIGALTDIITVFDRNGSILSGKGQFAA
jgi:hypothetical protein